MKEEERSDDALDQQLGLELMKFWDRSQDLQAPSADGARTSWFTPHEFSLFGWKWKNIY